jgi:hypothetical protein
MARSPQRGGGARQTCEPVPTDDPAATPRHVIHTPTTYKTRNFSHNIHDKLRNKTIATMAEMLNAFPRHSEKLKTVTQRMKKRYDAKVRSIQLEPEDIVLYYSPQTKIGRNQKWRKLYKIGQVVQRFSDVLYSVKPGPRSSPVVAHVDRLRRYDGMIL